MREHLRNALMTWPGPHLAFRTSGVLKGLLWASGRVAEVLLPEVPNDQLSVVE